MKKKMLRTKLSLNKSTVARLSNQQSRELAGGAQITGRICPLETRQISCPILCNPETIVVCPV